MQTTSRRLRLATTTALVLAILTLGNPGQARAEPIVTLVPETTLTIHVGETVTVDVFLSGASADPITRLDVEIHGYNPRFIFNGGFPIGTPDVEILGAREVSVSARIFSVFTLLGPDGLIGSFQVKGLNPGGGVFDLNGGLVSSSGATQSGEAVRFGPATSYVVVAAVPEPSVVVLAGVMGMAGLGYGWRRRRASKFAVGA